MSVEIIKIATEYGLSPLNLVLIVMVYFLGVHTGLFPRFWKKESEEGENKVVTLGDLHAEVKRLQGYFNHETTERLDIIRCTTEKTLEKVDDIKRKHDEYDRFGINIRK